MKSIELLKKFKNLFPKLYSFSYSIIQDDLQATQITIDAFTGYSWEEKEKIEELLECEDYSESQKLLFNIELSFYKIIFQLAVKRQKHLNHSNEESGNEGDFFALPIMDRAILFLKYRRELDVLDIENILDLKRYEVINFLNLAKRSILNTTEVNLSESRL